MNSRKTAPLIARDQRRQRIDPSVHPTSTMRALPRLLPSLTCLLTFWVLLTPTVVQAQTGSIGDRVWDDLDGDGVQDLDEPGLEGVTIRLIRGTIRDGGIIIGTQDTDADGIYHFTGLSPDTYVVQVVTGIPPNYVRSAGLNPRQITITTSEDFDGVDFGYQQRNATIGDRVWSDIDGDGVQDIGEPGLTGAIVELHRGTIGDAFYVSEKVTGADGAYVFSGLGADTYVIVVTGGIAEGYGLSAGSANPIQFTITAGQEYTDADIGFQQQDATISGTVWDDLDGDSVRNDPDSGLAGVVVNLYADTNEDGVLQNDEPELDNQTTVAAGTYTFTGLPPGKYIVAPEPGTIESGFVLTGGQAETDVSIAVGQALTDVDFGYQKQDAAIGNFVWIDLDGDGIQDALELAGLAEVAVELIRDSNTNGTLDEDETVFRRELTNDNGYYDHTGLPAGAYFVRVDPTTLPTAYVLTGGTTPDLVTLSASVDYNDADFGYQKRDAAVGGLVYGDIDGSGVKDDGESGIGGITLDLYGDSDGDRNLDEGEPLLRTQTTGDDGSYTFSGLPQGDYLIVVTDTSALLTGFGLTDGSSPISITLFISEVVDFVDFGYQRQDASIGDLVWDDSNGDGTFDNDESGAEGVTLDLVHDLDEDGEIDEGEPVLDTATADADGAYDFAGLALGYYIVIVTDTNGVLDGFALTVDSETVGVNLGVSQDFNDADFGYEKRDGRIGDFIWSDDNGDGLQDEGELGLGGVTLELYADLDGNGEIDEGEPVLSTQTTDEDGLYAFKTLAQGDFVVLLTDDDGVLTDYGLTGGVNPVAVELETDQVLDDVDFGYEAFFCGDGEENLDAEQCDDGNMSDGDGCSALCLDERCGDGSVNNDGAETCDDGNEAAGDGCSATCAIETGWGCDMGVCTAACGDGVVVGPEECDDDNGDDNDGDDDGCSDACEVEDGWTCEEDPGPASVCETTCGDGLLVGDEACDDGNTDIDDGCSNLCAIEAGWGCEAGDDADVCDPVEGDGVVIGDEVCDDGNTASDDGCTAGAVDDGYVCDGDEPSVCTTAELCGDGALDMGEDCDDGNTSNGDGCSAACDVETGFVCDDAEPSTCVADADGDDIPDGDDNCPDVSNPDQDDVDGDGDGDACDSDVDGDGLENASDNCPDVDSVDQGDLDQDGEGDVCDSDIDGDGLDNDAEDALGTDSRSEDSDGDGIGDGDEVNQYGTDPTLGDTDRGGVLDGIEIQAGTDPLDPSDDSPVEDEGCGCTSTRGSQRGGVPLLLGILGLCAVRRIRRLR